MKVNHQKVSIEKIVLFDDVRSDKIIELAKSNNILIYSYYELLKTVDQKFIDHS